MLLPERKLISAAFHARFFGSDFSGVSHSFTFIEKSIRNGLLENLEDHVVGPAPGTVRSVGSSIQPSKATRSKYTEEDDCVLWQWVHSHTQKGGGTDGNEIYKQLEAHVRVSSGQMAAVQRSSKIEWPSSLAVVERSMDQAAQRKTTPNFCPSQCTTNATFGPSSAIGYRNATEKQAEEHFHHRRCRSATWNRE